jgi:hypothetical protein
MPETHHGSQARAPCDAARAAGRVGIDGFLHCNCSSRQTWAGAAQHGVGDGRPRDQAPSRSTRVSRALEQISYARGANANEHLHEVRAPRRPRRRRRRRRRRVCRFPCRRAPECAGLPASAGSAANDEPRDSDEQSDGRASATCGQRRYCRRARHRIGPRRTAAARLDRLWTRADSRRHGRPCSAGRETPRHHHDDQVRAQGFIASVTSAPGTPRSCGGRRWAAGHEDWAVRGADHSGRDSSAEPPPARAQHD